MPRTPAYPDEPGSAGIPLITEEGQMVPTYMHPSQVQVAVWAHVPGKSIANPATRAESQDIWDGRSVVLQWSPNGVNWCTVHGWGDVTEDRGDASLSGNGYYRIIEGGDEAGGDLSNLRASVAGV